MNSSQMRPLTQSSPASSVIAAEGERKNLNSELWHACAGPLVSLPAVGSRVVYLPQGHSEQVAASTQKEADAHIPAYPNLPPQLFCQLHDVILHADMETDEVYCQMTLQPITGQEKEAFTVPDMASPSRQPNIFFCKTLTASDTSTHGGFSIPRRAAEKVFPPLDYKQQPPAQELIARDLHDAEWKFRHIYRGQPKRHLLTTGWSVFVSAKRLVAGDSVLFIRNDKGQLLLGIRRANRPQTVLPSSVLSSDSMHIGVLAAAAHAANTNSRFTVFYNPRASPSEFVIPYAKFEKAVYQTRVSVGMRFRMLFETEESSVRRYMGTVTDISDLDPVRWPNSQWRSIKVGWDESTACERQRRVSLWEIEPLTTFLVYPPTYNWSFKHPGAQPIGASFSNDFEMDGWKKQSMWMQFQNGSNVYNGLITSHGIGMLQENLPSKEINFQQQNPIVQSDQMPYHRATTQHPSQLLQQQQQQLQQLQSQMQSQQQLLHQPLLHQSHFPMLQPPTQYPSQPPHLPQQLPPASQLQPQPQPQPQTQQQQMQQAHQHPHMQHPHHQSLPQQQEPHPQQLLPVAQAQPLVPSFHSSAFALQHQKNATILQQQAQQQPNYTNLQQNPSSQILHSEQVQQRQQPFSSPNMANILSRLPSSQPQAMHNGAAATQQAITDSNAVLSSTNVSQTLQSIFSGFVQDTNPSLHVNSINTPQHFTRPPAMVAGPEIHEEPSVSTPWMSGVSQLSSRSQADLVNARGSLGSMCVTSANMGSTVLSKFSPEVPSNTYCYKDFSQEHEDMQSDLNKQSFGANADLQPMIIVPSAVTRTFTGTNEFQNQCASNFMQSQSSVLGVDIPFGSSLSNKASDDAHLMQQAFNQASPPVRTYTKVYKTGSVGRSLDVTRFSNYDELRCELSKLFGLEDQLEDTKSGWRLTFVDKENDWLQLGDGPWQVFVNNVRSIRILSPAEAFRIQDGVGLLPTQRQTSSSSEDGTIQQDSRNPSSVITSTCSLDY